jgi:hypothetical protein
MENKKVQINISIDASWRDRLDFLAAEETVCTGVLTNTAHLIRRALSTMYNLEEDSAVETVVHKSPFTIAEDMGKMLSNNYTLIRADNMLKLCAGMLCIHPVTHREIYHLYPLYEDNAEDVHMEIWSDMSRWINDLQCELYANRDIIYVEEPKYLRLGYIVPSIRAARMITVRSMNHIAGNPVLKPLLDANMDQLKARCAATASPIIEELNACIR